MARPPEALACGLRAHPHEGDDHAHMELDGRAFSDACRVLAAWEKAYVFTATMKAGPRRAA
jgi:hypothetical protein